MTRKHQFRAAGSAKGVALIEALIAILIFSFGVLGIVGLQVSMTRAQTSTKFRADAAFLANEVVGTMWADLPNFAQYDTASGKCAGHPRCADWKAKVETALPAGAIVIKPTIATGEVAITVNWNMPGEDQHKYVTTTNVHTSGE